MLVKDKNKEYAKARRIVEQILYEVEYFTNLDSEEGIEMDTRDFTKFFLKDVNVFLSSICYPDDNDYRRGVIISTLVKAGVDLDRIEDRIKYDCILRSTVLDIERDWIFLSEESKCFSMNKEYLHFNFYELYINVDNFKGTQEELVTVLSKLKKLGYVFIIVTKKQRISSDLRKAVYGVVKIK